MGLDPRIRELKIDSDFYISKSKNGSNWPYRCHSHAYTYIPLLNPIGYTYSLSVLEVVNNGQNQSVIYLNVNPSYNKEQP